MKRRRPLWPWERLARALVAESQLAGLREMLSQPRLLTPVVAHVHDPALPSPDPRLASRRS